jgi:DNA-directed RNA polymerase subunit RPC12/RpoP
MAVQKELIHEMFIEGKSYRQIAETINSNAAAVAQRIAKYRKLEPDKWPRLHKYVEPLSIKVLTYKCPKCVALFAIEKDLEFENEATCPFCWEKDDLKIVGVTYLKVKEDNL